MARDTFLGTDTLPAATTKWNSNVAKDDALQTATGIAEGSTDVGTLPSLPLAGSLVPVSTDDLLTVALKAYSEGADGIGTSDVRHSGTTGAVDRNGGDDYNYRTQTSAVMVTTNITSAGQATALGYPGTGIFHVQTSYANGLGGSAGRVRVALISDGENLYQSLYKDGVGWTTPLDVRGVPFTTTIPASGGSWTGGSGGAPYTYPILGSTHGQGTDVTVTLYDTSTPGSSVLYEAGVSVQDSTGDITLSVASSPTDARVATRVVIRANS